MHMCVWIKTFKGDRGRQHYCIKNEQRSGEPSLTFFDLGGNTSVMTCTVFNELCLEGN